MDNTKFYEHGCDFFSVEENEGNKTIHIHGYLYESDDHFAGVEVSFAILPLAELLAVNPSDRAEYINGIFENCSQYEEDFDSPDWYFNTYYDGQAPKHLRYEDITENTPCGHYAC